MIFGLGTDVAEVKRFEKWLKDDQMCRRFFADKEQWTGSLSNPSAACQHYAARFAAKEAFVKALGTGFSGVDLKDLWIEKTESGRPYFSFSETLKSKIDSIVGRPWNCFVSISHEKNYAVAVAVIEYGN